MEAAIALREACGINMTSLDGMALECDMASMSYRPRYGGLFGGLRAKVGAAEAACLVGASQQAALEDMWPLRAMGNGGPMAGDEGDVLVHQPHMGPDEPSLASSLRVPI